MSYDDKEVSFDEHYDLKGFFKVIWYSKIVLLLFPLLSIPISVYVTTLLQPQFRAETVFEKPEDSNNEVNSSLMKDVGSLGILSFFGGVGGMKPNNSFLSEIRSASFLKTVVLNNADLENEKLRKLCPSPSASVPKISFRSLLILIGLSENRVPTESQKTSLLLKCVNSMLEIDFDVYGTSKTSAYRLSITSPDPIFSANLANQIVEKYFGRHESSKEKNFRDVKSYLSKVIAEAQQEFTEANELIKKFKIKHTMLMDLELTSSQGLNSESLGGQISIPASPFAFELNKGIANLSQLEKSLNQLKKARLNLSKLKELTQEKIKTFLSATEVQGVFSRTFITAISKINNLSASESVTNMEITKIVSQELQKLRQQIQVLEEKISKREEQTIKLMSIENRFQELAIDVSKKKLIFEGLKDQLKEKILMTGLANVAQPVLLTKAVPPFSSASPNKKMIVVLGAVLSLVTGIAYILIKQLSLRRVHSLSQLQKLSRSLSCYKIKHKQLKQMSKETDETVVVQSFFSQALGMGKFGCIIDLSKGRQNESLASTFSKTIVSLLATDNSKILCLDPSPNKKPFSIGTQKNFVSENSDVNSQGILSKNILSFFDEEGLIGMGEVRKIKNQYSDCDKLVCVLGSEISDLTKFKFLEQCNFYILIGRSFHFDEYTYKKFSNTVWEKEKKCLGFFLID